MKISLIAAMDEKRGIGKDGKLPWRLPEDLKRFKELTIGHAMVMGRKTFASIGKVLPDRTNIVITHDSSLIIQGGQIAHSLEEAIEKGKEAVSAQGFGEPREVFIIGGGQIFEQAIGLADKLYLTIVRGDFGADTFFPDYSDFKKVIHSESGESGGYRYKFLELER